MQKNYERWLRGAAVVCAGLGAISYANAASRVGLVQFPVTPENGYFIEPLFAEGGQAVGLFVGPDSNPNHAALWTATGPIDLNPSQFANSLAFANSGTQQVGYGSASPTDTNTHALLWTGTAASAIDLTPHTGGITASAALGDDSNQQVGYISGTSTGNVGHACIWMGTAASVVDINPTNIIGISGSQAVATDGAQQVGNCQGSATGGETWAIVWSGSANTSVLLNPTDLAGYIQSFALGVGGNQQVGWGFNSTLDNDRALLWTGSAASAVDLTPTSLGFSEATASGTNGAQQVGWGEIDGTSTHAILWSGTANSAVDLQPLLPSTGSWTDSQAFSIDAFGNIYGIADGTYNGQTGTFAVEWILPEPGGALVVAGVILIGCRRWRGSNAKQRAEFAT